MRVFHCDRCGAVVSFADQRCPACDAQLGYVSEQRTIRVVTPAPDATFHVADADRPFWQCMNSAWGCNWMLPAGSETVWCRSCRMTRGRPDDARRDAIDAWISAEAAKRRLVHQIDSLGLPIEPTSPTASDGLAFDLVHVPGAYAVTGHVEGVVTLDLAEIDDSHRNELRVQLGESYRTVIGHLRHEIGHHYWNRLVGRSPDLDEFRRLFGDERAEYGDAITAHYETARPAWDRTCYVTAYASSHPHEDWAETFAHYLHIVDATDTAAAHGLVAAAGRALGAGDTATTLDFDRMLESWFAVSGAVNDIAESLGAAPIYPFRPAGRVVDKLSFVHRQVVSHAQRNRVDAAR